MYRSSSSRTVYLPRLVVALPARRNRPAAKVLSVEVLVTTNTLRRNYQQRQKQRVPNPGCQRQWRRHHSCPPYHSYSSCISLSLGMSASVGGGLLWAAATAKRQSVAKIVVGFIGASAKSNRCHSTESRSQVVQSHRWSTSVSDPSITMAHVRSEVTCTSSFLPTR